MEEMTAAETLDLIREGGTRVLMLAVQRLEECQSALSGGHFDRALTRCQEAQGCILQLAQAQNSLGMYGRNVYLVRAAELEEGMNLCQMGVVTEKSIESAPLANSFHQAQIVTVKLDGTEEAVQFEGDKQLLVWTH